MLGQQDTRALLQEKVDLGRELSDLLESASAHLYDENLRIIVRILEERKSIFVGLRCYLSFLNYRMREYEKQHPGEENPYEICRKGLFEGMPNISE